MEGVGHRLVRVWVEGWMEGVGRGMDGGSGVEDLMEVVGHRGHRLGRVGGGTVEGWMEGGGA